MYCALYNSENSRVNAYQSVSRRVFSSYIFVHVNKDGVTPELVNIDITYIIIDRGTSCQTIILERRSLFESVATPRRERTAEKKKSRGILYLDILYNII
jgi:hypothetical protein